MVTRERTATKATAARFRILIWAALVTLGMHAVAFAGGAYLAYQLGVTGEAAPLFVLDLPLPVASGWLLGILAGWW